MSKKIDIPKSELKRLYKKEKLSTPQIAKKFGCCSATVNKRLREHCIKLRPPGVPRVDLTKRKLKDWYINKKLSTWKIEKRYGYCRSTVHRKLIEYGIKTRSPAGSHIIYPRKPFDGNLKEKAYIIGFALGDLRVRKSYKNSETIKIDCGSTIPAQIILIENLFKRYGRVWKSKPDERGKVQIEAFLDLSFSFLLDMKNEINTWIIKDDECFAAFLAGFTDAEGSIFISNGQARYSLGNYDNEILFLIRQKLMGKRIRCAKIREDGKKRVTKNGYLREQNYFNLSINRKSDLLRLFDLIGGYLKHTKRINDMKRAKENIKIRNEKFGVRI